MQLTPINNYYKEILKIAIPAIAGLSVQVIISLVDAGMIGRLENAEYSLAAMGLGVLATWAIVSFFSSLATGTQVLVSHRFGRKAFKECGDVLGNSIFIGFIIGTVIAFLGVNYAYEIANFFARDRIVGDLAGQFFHYRILGIPFFLITVSYRGYFFGIGNTKIFMISGILINVTNIIFNYILIYGEFGIEPMGLAGSGLGSTIATALDALFYFVVSLHPAYKKKYSLYKKFNVDKTILKSIYKISLPVAFQSVFILLGFLSFVAVSGLIGITEQAATQAIISILFMSFLPCYGFGIATQTLVGNNIGRGKYRLARILGYETAKIATYYTVSLAFLFILIPQYLLLIITTEQKIIDSAINAMRIAGFAQIFYATGIVLANGLQACGRTTFVMISEVVANLLIFVPVSYFLGIYLGLGLTGAWLALPIYVITYSVIILLKFKYGKLEMS